MEEKIEIRDHREPGWFWLNREVITKHIKDIGGNGFLVYSLLAMHADEDTQKAWPSLNYMAAMADLSRTTVVKHLETLERAGLIQVNRKNGRVNVYILLKVGEERSPKSEPTSSKSEQVQGEGVQNLNRGCSEFEQTSPKSEHEQDSLTRLKNNTHTCVSGNFVSKMKDRYGSQKVEKALEALENQKEIRNAEAWVTSALRERWTFRAPQGGNGKILRQNMKYCLRGYESMKAECPPCEGILTPFNYCSDCPRWKEKQKKNFLL